MQYKSSELIVVGCDVVVESEVGGGAEVGEDLKDVVIKYFFCKIAATLPLVGRKACVYWSFEVVAAMKKVAVNCHSFVYLTIWE